MSLGREWARRGVIVSIALCVMLHSLLQVAPVAFADSSSTDGLTKAHPVILVHGWTGAPMEDTMKPLYDRLGRDDWQVLLFDYSKYSTMWAAEPAISALLANYILLVSQKQKDAGGDGLVYIVAHSMGGLAARFASVRPGVASVIGGFVTVGTPHQGSPWGNANEGAWGQALELSKQMVALPQFGSLARVCLAVHKPGQGLPAGCKPPPYFPSGVALEQIAGSVVVERRYFGLHAYDITIGGDGVVPTWSAIGYIGSGLGSKPKGSFSPFQVDCRLPDTAIVTSPVGSLLVADWRLLTDGHVIDQMTSEQVGPLVAGILVRISLAGDSCSHMAMMTNGATIDQIADSLGSLAAKHAPMTMARLRTVRVPSLCEHAAGKLVGGKLKIDPSHGYVQLDTSRSQIGTIVPGQPNGAVALMHCSQGGVSHPDTALFYDNTGTLVGRFDSGDVGAMGGRQTISRAVIQQGSVRIDIDAVPLSGDNELWGTSRASAVFGWNAGRRETSQRRLDISYPDPVAQLFAKALNNRDTTTAARLSPSSSTSDLIPPAGAKVRFDHCVGTQSDEYGEDVYPAQRGCLITYLYSDGNYSDYMAGMELRDNGWAIVFYRNVGG